MRWFILSFLVPWFFSFFVANPVAAAPQISSITDSGTTPKYAKFEITFQVGNTTAQNFQLPHLATPTPPPGIDPVNNPRHRGITVDGLFLPPGQTDWNQAIRQPAFYYQDYLDGGVKPSWADDGHSQLSYEWYYPSGQTAWKVRFAPHQTGTWQYRLSATDSSGSTQSTPLSFTVSNSASHGFIKVSPTDPRYFEFDDGTIFNTYGVEEQLTTDDPKRSNLARLQPLAQNKLTLMRSWHSGLYGASWLEWSGGRGIYDGYLPRAGLEAFRPVGGGSDQLSIALRPYSDSGWYDACRFDVQNGSVPVKPNTTYRLQLKYQASCIDNHPQDPGQPYGVIALVSQPHAWPNTCSPVGNQAVTNFGHDTNGWGTVETTWNSDNLNFLPRVGFGLVNTVNDPTCVGIRGNTGAKVWVDSISLREGASGSGPEVLPEPSLQYDLYFKDYQANRLDLALNQAEATGVYVKMELMEKNDMIWLKQDDDGTYVIDAGESDNIDGLYGDFRNLNRTRWLQQAYWRYVQARWGYSTAVHSWELTNEGEPYNESHWATTDELGKTMHCSAFGISVGSGDNQNCAFDHPNDHLVTTSFWHSFPGYNPQSDYGFWGNPKYPNVDYADGHAYITTSPASTTEKLQMEKDAAFFHLWHSQAWGGWNFPFPIVRGEAGMTPASGSTDDMNALGIQQDTSGVWFHNFVWSGLHSGSLYEIYWYYGDHIVKAGSYDHRPIHKTYQDFLVNIPLNNGHYVDAAPRPSNPNLRVVGQTDPVNHRAHLWVQNLNHTWKNVVDGVTIPNQSGSITLAGFAPNTPYPVERWTFTTNMTTPQIATDPTPITSNAQGTLTLTVSNLTADVAFKIGNYSGSPPPLAGDLDGDTDVDFLDLLKLIVGFNANGPANFNLTGLVDIFDFNTLLKTL